MKPVVLTVSIPATILSCQVNTGDDVADRAVPGSPGTEAPRPLPPASGKTKSPARPNVRRTEVGEWILQWALPAAIVVHGSEADDTPPARGLTLMTFDTASKVYRPVGPFSPRAR